MFERQDITLKREIEEKLAQSDCYVLTRDYKYKGGIIKKNTLFVDVKLVMPIEEYYEPVDSITLSCSEIDHSKYELAIEEDEIFELLKPCEEAAKCRDEAVAESKTWRSKSNRCGLIGIVLALIFFAAVLCDFSMDMPQVEDAVVLITAVTLPAAVIMLYLSFNYEDKEDVDCIYTDKLIQLQKKFFLLKINGERN